MNKIKIKLLIGLFILSGIGSLWGLECRPSAQVKEKTKTEVRHQTTCDLIQRAADMGEMTLKEAVILKAKLLFAPSLIPKDSKYYPKPNESIDCLTGFYKEVHKVFPELNPQEKEFLKSLSPDLEVVISRREHEEKAKNRK